MYYKIPSPDSSVKPMTVENYFFLVVAERPKKAPASNQKKSLKPNSFQRRAGVASKINEENILKKEKSSRVLYFNFFCLNELNGLLSLVHDCARTENDRVVQVANGHKKTPLLAQWSFGCYKIDGISLPIPIVLKR